MIRPRTAIVTTHDVPPRQVVTPWDVSTDSDGKINYNKLVEQFGCQTIDQALIERMERVTGVRAHPFLRRGIIFAHRQVGSGEREKRGGKLIA